MSDWRDTGAGNMKSQKMSATFQHMIQFQHMCVFDPLTSLEAYHHTHLSCIDTVEVILSDWRYTVAGYVKSQNQ